MDVHDTYTVSADNAPLTRKHVAAALISPEYQAVKDRSYELQRSFSQPGAVSTAASPSGTLSQVRMSLDKMIGMASQLHGSVAPLCSEAAVLPTRARTPVEEVPTSSAHGGGSGRSSRRPSTMDNGGMELQETTAGEFGQ